VSSVSTCMASVAEASFAAHMQEHHADILQGKSWALSETPEHTVVDNAPTPIPIHAQQVSQLRTTKQVYDQVLARYPPSKHKGPGFLYVLTDTLSNDVKIGKALHVSDRLRHAQTYNLHLRLDGIFFSLEYDMAETLAHSLMRSTFGRTKLTQHVTWPYPSEWFRCHLSEALRAAEEGAFAASTLVLSDLMLTCTLTRSQNTECLRRLGPHTVGTHDARATSDAEGMMACESSAANEDDMLPWTPSSATPLTAKDTAMATSVSVI
jgi:hypothetical protein